MHAYSYEHMELAAYELLKRLAERAGDEETARMAAAIADEEGRMAERLEQCFDAAVEVVACGGRPGGARPDAARLPARRPRARGAGAEELLESGAGRVEDEELEAAFRRPSRGDPNAHRGGSRGCSRSADARPSLVKDTVLKAGGLNLSAFFGAQPDSTTKLAGFAFAFEHLEIAAYNFCSGSRQGPGAEGVVAAGGGDPRRGAQAAERVAESWNRPGVPLGLAS